MKINLSELAIHGLMSFIGGIVSVISESKDFTGQSFTKFVAGGVIGIFAGMCVYFLCKHVGYDEYLSVALAALAGYMGKGFLDTFSIIAKRFLMGGLNYHLIEKEVERKKK